MKIDPEAVKLARERQKKLSAATDALTLGLVAAEEAIANLKLGVMAGVMFPDGERRLTFRKAKAWGLFVSWTDPAGVDEHTPIQSATREDRILAVPLLGPLVRAMLEAVALEIARVENASSNVRQFVEEVAPFAAPRPAP